MAYQLPLKRLPSRLLLSTGWSSCQRQPSISEQIRELEDAVGERLFWWDGRNNVLTDAGQVVFGYADEISTLGRELMNAVKQRPGVKTIRLYVAVALIAAKRLASA